MDKAFLCKDHIQMKLCMDYITEQYGEYCETYLDVYKKLFLESLTKYYKENEPVIVLVQFELKISQIEYGRSIFGKDITYWLYYRMTDYENYTDWDKYEMIDFNKLLRKEKLERIVNEA